MLCGKENALNSTRRCLVTQSHSQRVTRSDVAKEAGTSVAVVSYVINNGPRPLPRRPGGACCRRSRKPLPAQWYRPRSGLGSTQTYGLVAPDISNPFIASMAHALQREAFADGKVLLLGMRVITADGSVN